MVRASGCPLADTLQPLVIAKAFPTGGQSYFKSLEAPRMSDVYFQIHTAGGRHILEACVHEIAVEVANISGGGRVMDQLMMLAMLYAAHQCLNG